jgi:hypothetical protein
MFKTLVLETTNKKEFTLRTADWTSRQVHIQFFWPRDKMTKLILRIFKYNSSYKPNITSTVFAI